MKSKFRFARKQAFTLIEVTLAMGVASFAILSMLGVMVVGLNTLRDAIDTTVQAQISQQVVGALKQANFSTLSGGSWQWMFDDRGVVVKNDAAKLYSASAQVTNATLSGGTENVNLVKVVVTISNIAEPGSPYTFTTFVANNGQ